jgi:hypothetical protein
VQHPVDDFDALTARASPDDAPSERHNEDYPTSRYVIAQLQEAGHQPPDLALIQHMGHFSKAE